MDPNAVLQAMEQAVRRRDYRDASLQRALLRDWLGRGGFQPNWDLCPRAARYYGGVPAERADS